MTLFSYMNGKDSGEKDTNRNEERKKNRLLLKQSVDEDVEE